VDNAQTILDHLRNFYKVETSCIDSGFIIPENHGEGDPSKQFRNLLKIIVKAIKLIVIKQGYTPLDPKFNDHVIASFDKNFPN
jgi:hypothetical protein